MGIRSDVGLAIKAEAWDEAPDWFRNFWLENADTIDENHLEEGRFFIIEDVKWYVVTDEDIKKVVDYLRERPEMYRLVEACLEYPTQDGEEGEWSDNPWNLTLNISVSLSYEGD